MPSIAFPTARSVTETTSIPMASEPYAAAEPIWEHPGPSGLQGFRGPSRSTCGSKPVETKLLFDLGVPLLAQSGTPRGHAAVSVPGVHGASTTRISARPARHRVPRHARGGTESEHFDRG